jgi:hypothetical protein
MSTIFGRFSVYLILVLFFAILVGLLTLNYSATLVFLIGCFLSWPTRRFFQFVGSNKKKMKGLTQQRWFKIVWILLLLFFSLSAIFLFVLLTEPRSQQVACADNPIVEKYLVIIEPETSKEDTFRIRETVTNPCPGLGRQNSIEVYNVPEREISGSPRGLLLKEVAIFPLQSSGGIVNLHLQDGRFLVGPLCVGRCPESTVELRDFPIGSFYAAKWAEKLELSPYIDTEKITWTIQNLDEGIVFAYVPAPFFYLRPIIEPFAGASSMSQLLVGLFGLIGTIIVTPIVKPVLFSRFQNTLGSWLDKRSGVDPSPKVKIVVSGKGEEKEIDMLKKGK